MRKWNGLIDYVCKYASSPEAVKAAENLQKGKRKIIHGTLLDDSRITKDEVKNLKHLVDLVENFY